MNEYIAYCGLDCETCEARLATINNDNELRIKVSKVYVRSDSVREKNRWRPAVAAWK